METEFEGEGSSEIGGGVLEIAGVWIRWICLRKFFCLEAFLCASELGSSVGKGKQERVRESLGGQNSEISYSSNQDR
ncbi:hypothetical protein SLE2022_233000 [Rubroshorea leprosula]